MLGNEVIRDLLLLRLLLGNCQFSLARKEYSRFSDFFTYAHIVGDGDDAEPLWGVPVFITLTIVVLICPPALRVPEYFAV